MFELKLPYELRQTRFAQALTTESWEICLDEDGKEFQTATATLETVPIDRVEKWLVENNIPYDLQGIFGDAMIVFEDEKHAALFKITWL